MRIQLNFKCTVLNGKALKPGLTYESFLLEVINASLFFYSKRGLRPFKRPDKEDYGEADAISPDYSIDFKLLVNQDEMNSRSKNRPRVDYSYLDKGFVLVNDNRDAKPIRYDNILIELLNLDSDAYSNQLYSRSIAALRKNARKRRTFCSSTRTNFPMVQPAHSPPSSQGLSPIYSLSEVPIFPVSTRSSA